VLVLVRVLVHEDVFEQEHDDEHEHGFEGSTGHRQQAGCDPLKNACRD
jgi:hypothetical protein